MQKFNGGYKQYLRATTNQILAYIKEEAKEVSSETLGEFASISSFDIRDEVCFLIQLNSQVVGFVCMRFLDTHGRQLTRIYITPKARRHGCASYVMRGLKFTKANVPVRYVELVRLCLNQQFKYNDRQSYPEQLAELSRRLVVKEPKWTPR